jgi:NAD(P)-dependent dehydrogenase (short-subunit alcohol dehydrogenase family)
LGLEFVRQLLERRDLRGRSGGAVVATCRNPDRCEGLQELAARHRGRLTLLPLDVTDTASVAAAAAAVGQRQAAVHLLLNCSGVLHLPGGALTPETSLGGLTAEAAMLSYAVNALGPTLTLQAFMPLLRAGAAQRLAAVPAVVANLTARVGSMRENRLGGWHAYRASKAALNSLTRTVAVEQAREGSGVICLLLHPGTVDTALSRPFNAQVPRKMLFSPAQSVRCMLDVLGRASAEQNGQFLSWDGTQIDW